MLNMMLSLSLALASQGSVTRAPAPPPIIVSAPPAPPTANYPFSPSRVAGPAAILDIRIASEGRLLAEDTLRVGPTGAAITQSRSEAPSANCLVANSYGRTTGTNFRLQIQPIGGEQQRAHYNVDVSWSRPGSDDGCVQGGNRSVSLQQTVELAPGQEVMLRGDAGLSIRIRRR
jgi:hypothetical protein